MSGRGRSRGAPNQPPTRSSNGRGSAQSAGQAQSAWGRQAPAPAPAQSAWGKSAAGPAPVPAPAPAQSAWKKSAAGPAPVPAPAPAQSAWGKSAAGPAPVSAPAPAQSAWGQRAASAPNPVIGQSTPSSSSSAAAAEPRDNVRPQGKPQKQSPPGTSRVPRNGNSVEKRDRGSVRGRTVISDILVTRPQELLNKKGTSGTPVALLTNYFRLPKLPNWQLYQYRVDNSPPIENRGFQNKLIEQKATLGTYLFDGTMLFLTIKLPGEVTNFMSKDRDGNPVQTTVKFTGMPSKTSAAYVQILNLILRRSMGALELLQVGRNFFDPIAMINIPQWKLQVWPGYITSIRQHEKDILLCAEVRTKSCALKPSEICWKLVDITIDWNLSRRARTLSLE